MALRCVLFLITVSAVGCGSKVPNRVPVGETFPTVTGTSLDDVVGTARLDVEG